MATQEDSPQKTRVLEDINFASDRLSTQVRELSLGLLALVWALMVGEVNLGGPINSRVLLGIAALAILTMLIDFAQYIAGYRSSRRAWEDLRSGGSGVYQRNWLSHRIRRFSFGAKIVVCLINTIAMLGLLARLLSA